MHTTRGFAVLASLLGWAGLHATEIDLGTFSADDGTVLVNDTNQFSRIMTPAAGAIGDINNDGVADYAHAGTNFIGFDGDDEVFIVFGNPAGFPPQFALSSIDGNNGFRITDQTDLLRAWISAGPAGDVNGDGIDDLVLTARDDQPTPTRLVGAVILGRAAPFPLTLDIADLDGSNGFLLSDPGAPTSTPPAPLAANRSVDLNCDGIEDLVIGFPQSGPGGDLRVLFGGAFPITANVALDAFNGVNGVLIQPPAGSVDFGFVSSGLGDFNGDGCDDLAIGDLNANSDGAGAADGSGRVTIVFGTADLASPLDAGALDGSNGLNIESGPPDLAVKALGTDVAGGDFNGDGLADLLAGAPGGTAVGNDLQEGGAIIVTGAAANPATLEVRFTGGGRVSATRGFFSMASSSNPGPMAAFVAAGDFNGDGLADAAFAAPMESPAPNRAEAGVVYVLFGQGGGLPDQFALDTLAGNDALGFVVTGAQSADEIGLAVNAGDFNNDGGDELAIGGNVSNDFPAGSANGAVFWISGTPNNVVFADSFEG